MAFVASAAYADGINLVTNGTFTANGTPPTFTTVFAPDSSSISGWTVVSGSVDLIGDYWQGPLAGGNSIDLDGDSPGAISQAFSDTAGQVYTVTFYLSGNPDGPPITKTLDVSVDSTLETYDYTIADNSHSNMDYVEESFTFTGTGMDTLTFTSGDNGSPYGPVIGDVSVVPDGGTTTLTLLGLAVAGLAGLRRKLSD
jgi:choice-of-anchor C domain-containing protein